MPKTVLPETGEVCVSGPVGSADAVRNDDYRFLHVGLPVEVDRLKQAGYYDEARALCGTMLAGDVSEPLAARLRVERHRMGRLAGQYSVSIDEALETIRREWPDFTREQLDDLIGRGRIDWRFVRGEVRLLDSYMDSLRVYPHEVPGLLPDAPQDTAGRDEMLARMRLSGAASRTITVRACIEVPGADSGERVEAWLPVPAACDSQSDIEVLEVSPGAQLAPENAPARTVYWSSTTERRFSITYRYRTHASYVDLWTDTPSAPTHSTCEVMAADTAELAPHVMFTPYVRSLARYLSEGCSGMLEIARSIYDYVTNTVDYRYQPDYAQLDDIADNCLKSRRGDCGVMALAFVTLCRAAGIPARWESGLYVAPDHVGPHDWARFWTPETGWRWADCSFGSSSRRAGDETRRRHHFGNLDPWRLVANTEFQAELVPPAVGIRLDPYDSQMGEACVDGRGCYEDEMIRSVELLEMLED